MATSIDKLLAPALLTLSVGTGMKHEFDASLRTRGGGPVRYLLEVGDHPFLAWYDEDTKVVVVTPLERWDIENWIGHFDETEPVPVLSFREIDGKAFGRMAAQAIAAPALPVTNTLWREQA